MTRAKPFDIPKRDVWEAFKHVKANQGAAGVDGQSLQDFEVRLADNLYKLWNRLSSGSYMPPPVRRVEIPKGSGGTRPLGIPTVADRIAQEVIRRRLEPLVEPLFHADSYGYRPGRSAIDAIRTARQRCWRYDWVLDLDIKGFFDSIDWTLLLKAVRKHTDCPWVLLYLERWLKAPAMLEDGTLVPRERGTPQGGVISPLLANLFLHYAFDVWLGRAFPGMPFERCRRYHLPLPQRARGPDVASGPGSTVRRMRSGAPSGEDPGGLLQGHQPHGRCRDHPVRLPRLLFPAAAGEVAGRAVRRVLSAGRQPEGAKGYPSGDPAMVPADPERQGAGRPGADVQPVHPRLDQLLQPLLQVGAVSDLASDRRLYRQVGTTQVQAPAAAAAGSVELAGTGDPIIAGSVCPLAASAWPRPNTGSRMSREAHVRFWERAGVRLPRATRLPLNRQSEGFA